MSSDGDPVVTTTDSEKAVPSPVVSQVEGNFGIDSHDLPKGYFLRPYFLGTLVACGLSMSAGVGAFALAAPLLGVINDDIGPDPNYIWIALVYTLTLAIGLLLVGRLSDLFGRRWFFILGSILALIGCIVSATATSIPILIGGTVLIGFASASQLSYPFVLGELIPFKHRFVSLAFLFCWAVPFSGFGPAISYAFVQHTKHTWRSCYYFMIGINIVTVLCWFFFYFPPTFDEKYGHKKTKRQVFADFDFVGLILCTGGLLIFLMGISWGGSYYPWKSAHVIGTIVIGFLSLVAFVLYESFMPLKEPLVPMYLFRNLPWVADTLLLSLGASVYYAFAIVWPTMVFSLYTSDLTKGGLLCCVTGCGTNAGQIVGGNLCRRLGRQKLQLVIASVCMTAFLGSCACATPFNQNTIVVLLFLGCFSMGWLEVVSLAITSISIKDQAEIGTAVGIAGSIRSVISTVASAVYTVILTNRLAKTIPEEVPPKLIAAGLPSTSVASFLSAVSVGTPAAFSKVPGLTAAIEATGITAYKVASSHAYQTVFYSTLAFSIIAILMACLSPTVDDLMTDQVMATLHKHQDEEVASEK